MISYGFASRWTGRFTVILAALCLALPVAASAAITVTVSMNQASYVQGASYAVTALVKNGKGQPVTNASPVTLKVLNPRGSTVQQGGMINLGSGYYRFNGQLPSAAPVGTWTAKVSVTSSAGSATNSKKFTVTLAPVIDPATVDNDGDGYSEVQGDCNDAVTAINPGATEICGDGIDQDCSGRDQLCPADIDDDRDGYTENQGDCNDAAAAIHPGAIDICGDGIDQDCSGSDQLCPADIDDDRDGYTENQGDCNDSDATINPGAAEICGDGIDQDCNDSDQLCPADIDDDHDGYTENDGDCNDAAAAIHPGAIDTCGDGIDQDCSGADLECPPSDGHYGADCIKCHGTEANEVHGSLHYQWQGPAPDMVNQPGTLQGKMTNSVNSYCISILGNWAGCSACHVGKGAKPEATASPTQLANIDCLKCHSKGGVKPTRADCLTCHAKAGGGDAVKRGDLALATGNTADRSYDVHMATTGANLQCQSCHTTESHRIAGKGSDLRATDLDVKVECTKCHNASPHSNSTLNRHTARVACQTCHIPTYGKNAADSAATEATETFRTWKFSEAAAPPLHPASTKENNLVPRYRFWNGKSDNYLLGDIGRLDPVTGRYPTSRPVGTVQDGKLYPFKYKAAEQPMTNGSDQLIALDTKVFFATADPAAAIRSGLSNMAMSPETPWRWVETDTFQLLNHQVSPKEQALQCASCHGSTGRMNLKGELGYALKGPQSSLCIQCHSLESDKLSFQKMHEKHVTDKRRDCSWCHTFSRPERGLRMP